MPRAYILHNDVCQRLAILSHDWCKVSLRQVSIILASVHRLTSSSYSLLTLLEVYRAWKSCGWWYQNFIMMQMSNYVETKFYYPASAILYANTRLANDVQYNHKIFVWQQNVWLAACPDQYAFFRQNYYITNIIAGIQVVSPPEIGWNKYPATWCQGPR